MALLLAGCVFDGVAPAPQDDHARAVEDTEVVIDVLDNDFGERDRISLGTDDHVVALDPGGGVTLPNLAVRRASHSRHGQVELRGDGTVVYTPNQDFHGEDSFFYVLSYRGATARARVTIDVAPDSEQLGEPIVLYRSDDPMVAHAAEFGRPDAPGLIVQDGDRIVALARGEGLALQEAAVFGEPGCCDGYNRAAFAVADFDANGHSDLVLFGTRHAFEVQLAQPAEGDTGVRYESHPVDYDGPDAIELGSHRVYRRALGGAAGDFDGDGELDLAVEPYEAPGLIVHLGMAGGTPRASRVFESGEVIVIASGDLEGDGVADVVALTADGAVVWLRADPTAPLGFATITRRVSQTRSIPIVLRVGDVDGLPGDEVVLPDGPEAMVLHAAAGPRGPELQLLLAGSADIPPYPTLADFDGDGRAELLAGAVRGLEVWRVAELDGVPVLVFAADFSVPQYLGRSPLVLDFDRDGALDVIVSRGLQGQPGQELVLLPGQAP